jgi:ribosomal protein L18
MRKLNKKFSNPKDKQRLKRRLTIRKKVNGTTEKLRLCITKSNSNILEVYLQFLLLENLQCLKVVL